MHLGEAPAESVTLTCGTLGEDDKVVKGGTSIAKVKGENSVAVILTQHVNRSKLDQHMESIGV